MALTINTNIASIQSERALALNRGQMETAMQRLSSGKRINSALDDASGMAVAQRMRNQIEGLNMAIRNANDGISMSQTAEGAMEELQNVLQRMRELAVQSSNGTYTSEDRSYLSAEFDELMKEIRRVSNQAAWDGDVLLIAEGAKPMQVQVGINAADYITVPLQSLTVEDLNLADRTNYNATKGSSVQSIDFRENTDITTSASGTAGTGTSATTTLDRKNKTDATGAIVDVTFSAAAKPNFELELWDGTRDVANNPDGLSKNILRATACTSVQDMIAQFKAHPNYDSTTCDITFSGGEVKIVWKIAGQPDPATKLYARPVFESVGDSASATSTTTTIDTKTQITVSNSVVAPGTLDNGPPKFYPQEFTLTNTAFHTTNPKSAGNTFELQIGGRVLTAHDVTSVADLAKKLSEDSDFNFVREEAGFDPEYSMFEVIDGGAGAAKTLRVKFGEYATTRGFLRQSTNNVTIADPQKAITALDFVDKAATIVNESRARMGATMSRIEYTINNLMNIVENTEEAKSRILDTDYAKESANLAKAQILAQAGTAMLAQANQSQQYVLNLLRQG